MGKFQITYRTLLKLSAAIALSLAAPTFAQAQATTGQPPSTTTPPPLQFHYMGAASGGRIASVAGIAGNYSVLYLGSASGGVWKTTDGGHTFMPVFDDQDTSSIGALAVAPSDPNTVWAGTGEPWLIRPSDIIGDGVYKSTDAGKTWQHMGLEASGRIARIIVNPKDTNNVFVCATGSAQRPQQERGVYRTTDGGKTWKRTLFVNDETGCSSLSMDPSNPDTLLAGMWQIKQRTWEEVEGGPGSGVYISHNNGRSWEHLTASNGLPKPPYGKVGVAIAPSNPQRMYALISTFDQGSLWRSDNGGKAWKAVSWDRTLTNRAGYYISIGVNPKDDNGVLILNTAPHYSRNGGLSFSGEGGDAKPLGPASCGDCHDFWMDPDNPDHYVFTYDQGASIATGAGTALTVTLPNAQVYHVFTDNRVPYWIYGNRQDDGSWAISSDISQPSGNGLLPASELMPRGKVQSGGFFETPAGKFNVNKALLAQYPKAAPAPAGWTLGLNNGSLTPGEGGTAQPIFEDFPNACESGFTIPDPVEPNIVWSSCYGNKLIRFDTNQGTGHSVSPSEMALGTTPSETKYRCHWTPPMAIDPFNHNNVYYGCQMVLRTSDAGHTWIEFSPDLSTRDPSRLVGGVGVVKDNLGQSDGEVVWSLAFSPIEKGLLWAGTNDGKLWYTKGAESPTAPQWIDVTRNLHLPSWGEVDEIAPSHFNAGTAYVAIDYRLAGEDNNYKPYILMTTDYGQTWTNISGNLPSANPLDYTLSVAENPNRQGMLFAGTGHAFYYTLDNGQHWVHFNKGLPPSPVSWITVEPRMHDIVVSTYGRGAYVMPDITTFEQTDTPDQPSSGPTRLFKPGPIFRQAREAYPTAAEPARPQFQFYLADAPQNPVQLQFLDSQGNVIRTEKLDAHRGLNGAYWDLLYNTPTKAAIRTTPSMNPHIWDEPRFQGKTTRPVIQWGINQEAATPIAAPGSYQVRLTVNGQSYTQPFDVLKDPRIVASDATLQATTAFQVQVANAIAQSAGMINTMEKWRKQIQDQLKSHPSGATARALKELNTKILAVENPLVSPIERLSDPKSFESPYHLYMRFVALGAQVGQAGSTGINIGGGSDYAVTVPQQQIFTELQGQLAQASSGFENLKSSVVPAFNSSMQTSGVTISLGK